MRTLIIIALTICLAYGSLNPSRVILVDNFGYNLLFRTNSPVNSTGQFDYDELIAQFKNKTLEAGLPFPDQFELIDYSLLNPFNTGWKPENKFFKQNPHAGKLIHWIIIGSFLNPNSYPEFIRKPIAQAYPIWNFDQLYKLSIELRNQIEEQSKIPRIVFFHCEAGEDRTGEVYGGYQMLIKGQSYKQVLDFDNHVESRQIKKMSSNGMDWFCWHLYYEMGLGYNCDYEYQPDAISEI